MIKHTLSILRLASTLGVRESRLSQQPFALAMLTLALVSSGCMSDVEIPECAKRGTCRDAGASGTSGSGSPAGAGDGGKIVEQGNAGEGGELGGAGGEAGSVSGDGGAGRTEAGAGTGGAGTSGAGSSGMSGGGTAGGEIFGAAGGGSGGSAGRGPIPAITPTKLPAPCGTNSYSADLRAVHGTPPYHWEVSPTVDGWQAMVDPNGADTSFGLLTSTHAGAPEVAVLVTDAQGQTASVTYRMTPRSSCWFAYTAWTATGGATLRLVDPILATTPPVTFVHNHDVYDFAFSPNGAYLSYRFGVDVDHEKGRYLALVNLATWTELQLSFSDDPNSANDILTAYAWSADSSTLAATFTRDGEQFLGGVQFVANGSPTKLTPLKTAVDSELSWIASTYLVFYANGSFDPENPDQLMPDEGFVTAFYSKLGAVGFEKATRSTEASYELPVFMQVASDGFFVDSPSYDYLQFNWIHTGGPSAVPHMRRIVSPSGRVTADPPNGALKLYRAVSRNQILTDAQSPDRDCPKLLTWAKGKERIACVRDVAANAQGMLHSELRILDLDDSDALTATPIPGYCVKNAASPTTDPCAALEYDYSIADANLAPRVFSNSGDWLAFAPSPVGEKPSYLYIADLRVKPFKIAVKLAPVLLLPGDLSTSKLAFSADESMVLRQIGANLSAYSVSGGFSELYDFDENAPDSNSICSEDYASAPARWCGSATREAPFQWSPQSTYAAYRSTTAANAKALKTADFTGFPEPPVFNSFAAPACGSHCSGQFSFQP